MALNDNGVVNVLQALKGITSDPDQCFSVYDVTKATRNLTDENIRHNDVRELMHKFYDEGFLNKYTRTPRVFWRDGQQVNAQLFVPAGGDPDNYDPDEVTFDGDL